MMRTALAAALTAVTLLLSSAGQTFSAVGALPLVQGKPTLAMVNGEPITLEDFDGMISEIHSGMTDNAARPRSNPSEVLDRLINVRLILQEARNIGLDELQEVKGAVKTFGEDTLRGMLYGYHVRNIREPDKKQVEKRYREAVKEMKVTSVLFDKEEDAKRMEAELRAGGKFRALAKKRIDAGEVKGSVEGQFLKFESLSPEVAKVVSSMKKGGTSSVIRIGDQFALLELEDIRYPKDKAARERAEKDALQAKHVAALKVYSQELRKRYVTIDRKLLDGLDYESDSPGLEKLRKDQRVVAKVKGEAPITVGDLTISLEKRFFHGAERAAERKKINPRKHQVMEEILNRRVAIKEAKKQKLDRTDFYKRKVEEHRNGILFGTFVSKVVVPDVRVEEEESKAYYQEHLSEYSYPEMVRIDGMVFSGRSDAEEAVEKLRKGADFKWLRENAEGQVDAEKRKNLPEFVGNLLDARTLPDGFRKALSGAAPGDYRLYADPGGTFFVLHVQDRIPPKPMPYDSVKAVLEKKMFNDRLQKALREWEEKLRSASDVQIYVTGADLDRIVKRGSR